ncbi:MAG: sulfurtransferase-like selenium metabolism protein YedF [Deltaproteobacteria bacterium]|nr:sulfurtransferase-like selenium metabolism protein YedF [Deltaproteobacteria bacterium]
MKKTVDARGLACPQPVVLTLKALADAAEVTTIVDDQAAVENVTRLARSKGCSVAVAEKEDGIHLTLRREGAPAEPAVAEHVVVCSSSAAPAGPLVVFVPSDCFGRGPAELGERLMGAFFHSLLEVAPKPKTLIFMNSGVKLVVEGSRVLEDVRALAALGIEILVCGTCLGYFELTDKLGAGQISNMYDIATSLLEAGRIVEL